MNTSFAELVRRGWFVGLLAVLFIGLGVKYSKKAIENRSAIQRWFPQIKEMEKGTDISGRFQYPNPPIMAIILEPLVQLPPVIAALTWFYLKVGMAVLAMLWVFRLIETPERPFPAWAKGLTVILSLRPIMGDLDHGNVNLFILFLVVLALTAYRKRWDLAAGCTLALAIACKVTPALFVPYFLWKRSWRVLGGCALGLALFFWPGFVPALRLGWHENQQQLTSWYNDMVRPFVVEGKVWSEHNNQSLGGLGYRMLTASPSFSTYVENVYTPTRYDNIFSLPREHVRWLLKGCMGLFVLVVVWSCRTATEPRQGWRLGAEFALITLGMLLFSERTWKHHCVTLILPFAVLSYYLASVASSSRERIGVAGALAAVMVLMASTSTGTRIWPDGMAELAQVYGAYTIAWLLLAVALVRSLKRGEPATAAETTVRTVRPAAA